MRKRQAPSGAVDGTSALASVAGRPLPQFLEWPRSDREPFGVLRRRKFRGEDTWEIEGDPQAILMAKRLFPGAEGRGSGHAKFPATARILQDLIWFMHRYPLRVEDPDSWRTDYQSTVDYVLKRDELNRNPVRIPPSPLFLGKLRPFQEEGLSWLLTNRKTLLADDMGLGKTLVALAFMVTAADWPALVVAPPHVVGHWQEKSDEFLAVNPGGGSQDLGPLFVQQESEIGDGVTVHVITGLKPYELPPANIYIIHYLLLRGWRRALVERDFPTVIFDEVQELRHTGTEKYSAASELGSRARNVFGLSGTPIYNRGAEIWNVLNALEFHCLGDYDGFTREWCTGYGRDIVRDAPLLNAYLKREGLMLRRRKEDVLQDLPPKRRLVVNIDADYEQTGVRELIQEAVATAKGAEGLRDFMERGRMERQALDKLRRATGIAKAPAVAMFVRGLMEAEEPTLVFVHHHAVIEVLLKALKQFNPVCITGLQTKDEKEASRHAFMDGNTNLCIIGLRAATGLDGLQERARVVVFGELDWSPAVHSQAEDRAHRFNQMDSVLCYYLVSGFGMDPEMQESLGLKVSQFVGLMGDRGETEEDRVLAEHETSSHMKRVLAKLRGEPVDTESVEKEAVS